MLLAKSEENARLRPVNWLWCQLKDLNQSRHIAVCKKIECKYLEINDLGVPNCHCPTSLQYLSALSKKVSQEDINKARAERKAGRKLEKEPESETEE